MFENTIALDIRLIVTGTHKLPDFQYEFIPQELYNCKKWPYPLLIHCFIQYCKLCFTASDAEDFYVWSCIHIKL